MCSIAHTVIYNI